MDNEHLVQVCLTQNTLPWKAICKHTQKKKKWVENDRYFYDNKKKKIRRRFRSPKWLFEELHSLFHYYLSSKNIQEKEILEIMPALLIVKRLAIGQRQSTNSKFKFNTIIMVSILKNAFLKTYSLWALYGHPGAAQNPGCVLIGLWNVAGGV